MIKELGLVKNTLGAMVLWVGLYTLVQAQPLEQVVKQTLTQHPDVLAAEFETAASRARQRQALAGWLPRVDLALGAGQERSNNTTTRSEEDGSRSLTRRESRLSLDQLVFDGGQTHYQIEQQTALIAAATAQLASTQEQIGLRVVEVYLDVLRQAELNALAQANVQSLSELMAHINNRNLQGVGKRVDLEQVRGRVAFAKTNAALIAQAEQDASARYYRVVTQWPQQLQVPGLPGLPRGLEQVLALGESTNPEIQLAQYQVSAGDAAQAQAKAVFWPELRLQLESAYNEDIDGVEGRNSDLAAVLRFNYNLYRGGADQARVRETTAAVMAARQQLVDSKRNVSEQLRVIWNALQSIGTRLPLLAENTQAVLRVRAGYREQFNIGQRTLLDLLDIENELLRTQSAEVSTRYAELFASYSLLASIGMLRDHFGLAEPTRVK